MKTFTCKQQMGRIKIISKSQELVKFIEDCPKDITVITDYKQEVKIIMDGETQSIRNEVLRDWAQSFGKITPTLCGILYNIFGFIPFEFKDDEYVIHWDKHVDVTTHPGYENLSKPTVMVDFIGMKVPKAIIKQMSLITEAHTNLGYIFENFKKFIPDEEDFPEYIRPFVKPAISQLSSQDKYQESCIEHLYVYEILGIPLTNTKYFINGEELIELNNKNLIKHGKFYGYDAFSIPPFPVYKRDLSHESVSYITNNMIETFRLVNNFCVDFNPTPFQIRICKYIADKYLHTSTT